MKLNSDVVANEIILLTKRLCSYRTLVCGAELEGMFKCLSEVIPVTLHSFPSGSEHNGWVIPKIGR